MRYRIEWITENGQTVYTYDTNKKRASKIAAGMNGRIIEELSNTAQHAANQNRN